MKINKLKDDRCGKKKKKFKDEIGQFELILGMKNAIYSK